MNRGVRVRRFAALTALVCMLACARTALANGPAGALAPEIILPPIGLYAEDLALIVNDDDPASVEVGRYYAERRKIAADHVIHVRFPPGRAVLSELEFERVQSALRTQAPVHTQAYALAWTLPYRVECMSITSAFAFGFDRAYCAEGCRLTKTSRYFDSHSNAPFTDFGLRPAMMLAGRTVADAKAMIDRGVRSDERWPDGAAYLLSTSDRKRNVRMQNFNETRRLLRAAYAIRRVDGNELDGAQDVMFYFTGVQRVVGMASNRFLDGALADDLTSLGGLLDGSPQTSALDWLAAGATGSYGTTSEPCNYTAKFPEISVVMGRYLSGETLIEAYWKSVRMPGQGVFVGEPLARPFGGLRITRSGTDLLLRTHLLRPGHYAVQVAVGKVGPFRDLGELQVATLGVQELRLPAGPAGVYRIVRLSPLAGH